MNLQLRIFSVYESKYQKMFNKKLFTISMSGILFYII